MIPGDGEMTQWVKVFAVQVCQDLSLGQQNLRTGHVSEFPGLLHS